MIKDLLLHDVDNSEALEVISGICSVQSEINYTTIWFEGKPTSIQNGDRLVYLSEDQLSKVPETIQVKDYTS